MLSRPTLSTRRRRSARKTTLGKRVRRRITRRPVPAREVIPHGVYIHKQWGKDTRTNRTTDTEVVVSAQTLLHVADPDLVVRADASIDLGCIIDAFDQAGFPAMWLLDGLEELGAAEIRRLPRREIVRLRTKHGIPYFPRVLVILRIFHIKYKRVRSRPYEYWLLLEVTPLGCVPIDWDFGTGRLGRPKKEVVV